MARFLTMSETVAAFEKLTRECKGRLTVITPYVQISPLVLRRLEDVDKRGVHTDLVYRTHKLTEDEHEKLKALKNLRLHSLELLHAKCYANEDQVIISSMNLYEFSQRNNWEMSVLLSRDEDPEAFESAFGEIRSIIQAATVQERPGVLKGMLRGLVGAASSAPAQPAKHARNDRGPRQSATAQPARAKKDASTGHCIRCGTRARYRPQSPLCGPCYDSWAEWQDEDYRENVCHRCGKDADVTKAKPLCYACFREAPFVATL